MTSIHLSLLVICIVSISIIAYFEYKQRMLRRNIEVITQGSLIVCVMITGKNSERIKFARKSIDNFNDQTYNNKKLLIINHNINESVIDKCKISDNIFEFQINKTENITLGDLRNIASNFIPFDSYWITWDDDDWRSPHFLSSMWRSKVSANADFVYLTSRLEYNYNNGLKWVSSKRNGFVHILAPLDKRITYLSKDTMEDVNLIKDYTLLGYTNAIASEPSLYLRLVHGDNTSLYVDKNKNHLIHGKEYFERPVTIKESKLIDKILVEYYNK